MCREEKRKCFGLSLQKIILVIIVALGVRVDSPEPADKLQQDLSICDPQPQRPQGAKASLQRQKSWLRLGPGLSRAHVPALIIKTRI